LLLPHIFSSLYGRLLCAVLASGVILGLDLWRREASPPPAHAVWPVLAGAQKTAPLQLLDSGNIPMPSGMAAAHASTLLALPLSHPAALMAFWFSGDRESAPNVQIAASQWDRASQQWSAASYVVNRQVFGSQMGFGLRRLGNPVAWLDGSGRVHLFVVATGWGGWAASRILHLRQISSANSVQELVFEPVRVLPLSWLWNTSILVRNAPLPLDDGGMVLPVHFELGIKYPIALRFDKEGTFQGVVRMSARPYLLQPTLLMQSTQEWLALMRDDRPNGKVGVARTVDGGLHWADLPDLALDNPDAAVAGFNLAPGRMLLVHNSSIATRATLDLSQSMDGRNWPLVRTLEQGAGEDEFSYPAMAWADGELWVSYTVDRHRIAWQRFALGTAPAGVTP